VHLFVRALAIFVQLSSEMGYNGTNGFSLFGQAIFLSHHRFFAPLVHPEREDVFQLRSGPTGPDRPGACLAREPEISFSAALSGLLRHRLRDGFPFEVIEIGRN
jgi:hypothetical protein